MEGKKKRSAFRVVGTSPEYASGQKEWLNKVELWDHGKAAPQDFCDERAIDLCSRYKKQLKDKYEDHKIKDEIRNTNIRVEAFLQALKETAEEIESEVRQRDR